MDEIDITGEVETQLEPIKAELINAIDDIHEANRRIEQLSNETQRLRDEIKEMKSVLRILVQAVNTPKK